MFFAKSNRSTCISRNRGCRETPQNKNLQTYNVIVGGLGTEDPKPSDWNKWFICECGICAAKDVSRFVGKEMPQSGFLFT